MEKLVLYNLVDSVNETVKSIEKDIGNNFTGDIEIAIRRLVQVLMAINSISDLAWDKIVLLEEMIVYIHELNAYLSNRNNIEFASPLRNLVVTLNTFCLIIDLSRKLDITTEFNKKVVEDIIEVLKTKTLGNIYEDPVIIEKLIKLQLPQSSIQQIKDGAANLMYESNKNKNISAILLVIKEKFISTAKQFEIKEIKVLTLSSDPSIGNWDKYNVHIDPWHGTLSNIQSQVQKYRKLQNCQFIAQFYGVCDFDIKTVNVIYEYPMNGFLDQWLYSNDVNKCLSPIAQSRIVIGITNGLMFMHSNEIVHGALQSKNVMLDAFMVPKLKFSQNVEMISSTSDAYKWKAPEYWEDRYNTINDTYAGDVYSYGIVVCEIYSKCRPWSNATDDAIKDAIAQGRTPYTNVQIPTALFNSISKCWGVAPNDRPSMALIINSSSSINRDYTTVQRLIIGFNEGYLVYSRAFAPIFPPFIKSIFSKFTINNILMTLVFYYMVIIAFYAIGATIMLWAVPVLAILFLAIAFTSIFMTFYGLHSFYKNKNANNFYFSILFICLAVAIINFVISPKICHITDLTSCLYIANECGSLVLLHTVYNIILLLIIKYLQIDKDTRILDYFVNSWDEHGRPTSFVQRVPSIVPSVVLLRHSIAKWILGFFYLINILNVVVTYTILDGLGYLYLPIYSDIVIAVISIVSVSSTIVGMVGLRRKNAVLIFQFLQIILILLVIALTFITNMVCDDFADAYIDRNGDSSYFNRHFMVSICKFCLQDIEGALFIWFIVNVIFTRILQRILTDEQNTPIIDLLLPKLVLKRKFKFGIYFLYFLLLVAIATNSMMINTFRTYYYYKMTRCYQIIAALVIAVMIGFSGLKWKRNVMEFIGLAVYVITVVQLFKFVNKDSFCLDFAKKGNATPDAVLLDYCDKVVRFEGIAVVVWILVIYKLLILLHKYGNDGFVQLGDEHEEALVNGIAQAQDRQ